MHLQVTRCNDNVTAFPWYGKWPEYNEYRFPDLILCIQGDTLLPQLCFYIAAGWHVDPRCVTFYIGDEEEGFTHEFSDKSLSDVPFPSGYNELFVTARLRDVPQDVLVPPVQWEVLRDDVSGLDTLHFRVDALRCWGCGKDLADDVQAALLRCGHTHCGTCINEACRDDAADVQCKYCHRKETTQPSLQHLASVLQDCRDARECNYTACDHLATHRCWCHTLVCAQHAVQHTKNIQGHHTRPIKDYKDTAPLCYHDVEHVSARRTMYCTHLKRPMCTHCLVDATHNGCPHGAHVDMGHEAALTVTLSDAAQSYGRLDCSTKTLDNVRTHSAGQGFIDVVARLEVEQREAMVRLQSPSFSGALVANMTLVQHSTPCGFMNVGHHLAATRAASNGHMHCLNVLYQVKMVDLDDIGSTLARAAAAGGHIACLQLLRDAGIDLAANDNDGRTPAHFAAMYDHVASLQLLRDAGIDLAAKRNDGRTPAHFAAMYDRVASLQLLRDAGIDLAAKDNDGKTPAHFAAMYDLVASLQLLRDAGIDLAAKDNDGKTPAHLAAIKGHVGRLCGSRVTS